MRSPHLTGRAPVPCFLTFSVSSDKLQKRHRRGIAAAGTELQDARVAALTLRVLACNIAEKLPNCFFIANIGNRLTAGGKIATLCQRDELFREAADFLCLRFRRLDALMLEEGGQDAAEECLTGTRITP